MQHGTLICMGLHLLYYLQPIFALLIFIIPLNALVINGEHSSLYPHPKDMLLESPQSSAVIIIMYEGFGLHSFVLLVTYYVVPMEYFPMVDKIY